VKPADFNGATIDGDTLTAEIPPRAVVVLKLTNQFQNLPNQPDASAFRLI
jgi:hypothetical protein